MLDESMEHAVMLAEIMYDLLCYDSHVSVTFKFEKKREGIALLKRNMCDACTCFVTFKFEKGNNMAKEECF